MHSTHLGQVIRSLFLRILELNTSFQAGYSYVVERKTQNPLPTKMILKRHKMDEETCAKHIPKALIIFPSDFYAIKK